MDKSAIYTTVVGRLMKHIFDDADKYETVKPEEFDGKVINIFDFDGTLVD